VKSYRFRLANVARIRALEERIARERFLTSLRALRQAELSYRRARDALTESVPLGGVVSSDDVQWSLDQSERLARVEQECRAECVRAAEMNDGDREHWREAAKRARALERLDERARVAWLADYRREEALELDDAVNARYVPSGVSQ
jgi:flagellar biosynthesis chaperone FliJ